jgi:hypothetical protein
MQPQGCFRVNNSHVVLRTYYASSSECPADENDDVQPSSRGREEHLCRNPSVGYKYSSVSAVAWDLHRNTIVIMCHIIRDVIAFHWHLIAIIWHKRCQTVLARWHRQRMTSSVCFTRVSGTVARSVVDGSRKFLKSVGQATIAVLPSSAADCDLWIPVGFPWTFGRGVTVFFKKKKSAPDREWLLIM